MSVVNESKTSINNRYSSIKYQTIIWLFFALQILFANIAKHSIYYQLFAFLFILSSFVYLFMRKAIRLNKYYLTYLLFIIYNSIIIVFGNIPDSGHSIGMLRTISLNLILFVLTYSFFTYVNNINKVLSLYVNVSLISCIVILYIHRSSLLTGRLAFSWGEQIKHFSLFGVELATMGPNGIAHFCAIAFLLSCYLIYSKVNRKRYIFYNLVFLVTILMTGSRKGLLILVLGLSMLVFLFYKGRRRALYTIISIFVLIIICILIMRVPSLYDIVGSRVSELINFALGRSVEDSSINTRLRLMEMGSELFDKNPVYGYGLDAFRQIGPWGIVTDNNYLEILVSSGIIGFLIYYSYAILVIKDFLLIRDRNEVVKLFIVIFVITLFLEIGSVTYFERSFGMVNAMLYFVLNKQSKKGTIKMGEINSKLRKFTSRIWHLPFVQFFVPDSLYLKIQFKTFLGENLNVNNTVTFNEKIQWLKLYDRNEEYTKMVDKYEVREYIKDKIGEEYLIPLLGVYDSFDEIDFNSLPSQFVLKPNHTSGDVYICKDKDKINYKELENKVNSWLKRKYYLIHREWPYKNVKPRIVCEEFIIDDSAEELIDYKFMCFNGEPKCLFVASNRNSETGLTIDFYDIDWNLMPFERKYPNSGTKIAKPENFNKMVEFAKILSENIPFVRVDFYEANGKLYFGELTFYPGSGLEAFTPRSYDELLGSWINLPNKI
ncbi:ATP-grasp fold amidoligase family protein [Globicatella sulfidifaciens]|uniref:O-antigen ligase-related domain-containing protein n=1 Tax=Globicatella sulfidifaciens TaxID=136093 RepID=A0A7X8C3E8_9LACT|nr:ATP-grasp fold amidoligase family protein [Globicatella sulfidifaciens]NLJ18276.1 hypothetical protein [Globicatella sulfidifaciens]